MPTRDWRLVFYSFSTVQDIKVFGFREEYGYRTETCRKQRKGTTRSGPRLASPYMSIREGVLSSFLLELSAVISGYWLMGTVSFCLCCVLESLVRLHCQKGTVVLVL